MRGRFGAGLRRHVSHATRAREGRAPGQQAREHIQTEESLLR